MSKKYQKEPENPGDQIQRLHELEKQLSAGPTSLNIEVSEEAKTEKKYDTQKFSESEKSDSVRTEM